LAELSELKLHLQTAPSYNEHLDAEDNEFWQAIELAGQGGSPQEEGILLSSDDKEIIAKSEAILKTETLRDSDREELFRETGEALKGDRSALERLSNLLYFLE